MNTMGHVLISHLDLAICKRSCKDVDKYLAAFEKQSGTFPCLRLDVMMQCFIPSKRDSPITEDTDICEEAIQQIVERLKSKMRRS